MSGASPDRDRDRDRDPDRDPDRDEEARHGHGARSELTISQAQEAVDAWISRFEEGYWPPLANLARLVEEVGELARELNHRYGSKPKKSDEPEADLALELADIMFVLMALANEQGIELEPAFRQVMEKYRVRDAGRWREKE